MKEMKKKTPSEESFDLKYCERCGALWLRPASEARIYCVGCSHEMAQLPPSSSGVERGRTSRAVEQESDNGDRYEGGEINFESLEAWNE